MEENVATAIIEQSIENLAEICNSCNIARNLDLSYTISQRILLKEDEP